ncbi:MAG: SDR family NAD(P)-dependent oxidoreductase [Proteobacteria bacterium]|nr:MAG: SDR family NAD(P)-dependent oxidoreductase [Pseudomonadota bacterium]
MSSILYEQSLSFKRPLDFVFTYLADHSHMSDWAPSVTSASKTTPGPVRVGTHFDIQMRFGLSDLSLDYHVTALEHPQYIELKGKGETFSIVERLRLEGEGDHCHLLYQIEVYYQEPVSKLVRFFSPIVKSSIKKDLVYLQKALDQQPSSWKPTLWSKMGDRLLLPGMLHFSKKGFASAKDRWIGVTEDLTGRNIVITGPTSGIGAAVARQLAKLNANLIFVCRNEKKALIFADALEVEGYPRPRIEIADISSVLEVEALAARLLEKGEPIHALINNAGALFNQRGVSAEGLELSFATLLLGPFILTERLYPLLKKAGEARVINVSSGGMYMQAIALDDMEFEKEDYNGDKAYARAKRGLVDMTELWAERWKEDGIVVHAMHPGWADTAGVSAAMPKFYDWTKTWLRSPEQGADTVTWLAASKEARETSGLFWLDRTPHTTSMIPGTRSAPRHQSLLRERLEEYSQKLSAVASQSFR